MKIKKIFILLFVILSLIMTLSVTAFAAGSIDSEEITEWAKNGDGSLTDGVSVYRPYPSSDKLDILPFNVYVYRDSHNGEYTEEIFSYEKGGMLIWHDGEIYATDYYKGTLDELLGGRADWIRLESDGKIGSVDASFRDTINDKSGAFVVSVLSNLEDCLAYRVLGYDTYLSVCTVYGTIYEIGDKLYYLDHSSLPDSCFDSNGELTYVGGQVKIYQLSASNSGQVSRVRDNLRKYSSKYTYEDPEHPIEQEWTQYEEDSITSFYVFFVILFYLVPIAFGAISLAIGLTRSYRSGRNWFIVTGLSALWIIISTVILILIN